MGWFDDNAPTGGGNRIYPGGSATFDERTGYQAAPAGGGWFDTNAPTAGGGADPVSLIRQYQASHPAAGGSGLDDMVAYLQANGVNASRYNYGGTLSNNEINIPGYGDAGKYKVFSEGNSQWYMGGDDSPGGGGGGGFGGIGAGLEDTPGYQFRLSQGLKALQSSAAAKGTLLTGGTLKGLERYAQDVASQEYGNRVNQLMSLSQLGLNAAGQQAGLGTSYAGQAGSLLGGQANLAGSLYGQQAGLLGGLYGQQAGAGSDLATQAGNAAAAGTVGQANASANMWNQLGNLPMQYIMLSQLANRSTGNPSWDRSGNFIGPTSYTY